MKRFCLTFTYVLSAALLFAHNPPVANSDTAKVPENGPVISPTNVVIPVTANDVDAGGGQLTVTIVHQPGHGSALVINTNKVIYSPDSLFYGLDSFQYAVTDTFNLSGTATVYINVLGSNLPPVASSGIFTVSDTAYSQFLNILAEDSDPNHDTIFIIAFQNLDTTGTLLGTLGIDSASGQVLFSHNPYTCGAENFAYVLCNYSRCDTGQITVIINCPDSISLPRGFSPNGDGKNDFLVFTGIEYFQPASLKVFNRYGAIVYENSDYQNNWDGTNSDTHNALPDGTYFYVLQLGNGHAHNNYVIINR